MTCELRMSIGHAVPYFPDGSLEGQIRKITSVTAHGLSRLRDFATWSHLRCFVINGIFHDREFAG
jgi:hypothetical protein